MLLHHFSVFRLGKCYSDLFSKRIFEFFVYKVSNLNVVLWVRTHLETHWCAIVACLFVSLVFVQRHINTNRSFYYGLSRKPSKGHIHTERNALDFFCGSESFLSAFASLWPNTTPNHVIIYCSRFHFFKISNRNLKWTYVFPLLI